MINEVKGTLNYSLSIFNEYIVIAHTHISVDLTLTGYKVDSGYIFKKKNANIM